MEITYENEHLEKLINNYGELKKKYGEEIAYKLQKRLVEIDSAPNLNVMKSGPPHFRHKLKGNRNSQYAIDITRKYKLIIIPMDGDDKEALSTVTRIKIIEISNHYE
ncbi:MAG: type II toxin-antitoxin system RelE/ParE family toxin [Clostridia bacterium]|nr:type II toxin-antitoxin system RelE/ParE family toxin [Clostridia bacterium]